LSSKWLEASDSREIAAAFVARLVYPIQKDVFGQLDLNPPGRNFYYTAPPVYLKVRRSAMATMKREKEKQQQHKVTGIRLGLCCIFKKEPIRFRATTAKYLLQLSREEQLQKLSGLCRHNTESLLEALCFLHENGIGAFRILSPLFPRFTHPEVGYLLEDLPDAETILKNFKKVKDFREQHDIRLSFHPDQFIILSSPHEKVVANSIRELEYQGMLADYIGAELINIHGGGAYGDKRGTLQRFEKNAARLSPAVRKRLSLENDDRTYTVEDLAPLGETLGVPLVFDVHHHRCNPGSLTVEEATALSLASWERLGREPYFHVSSPLHGWQGKDPRPHADFIDPADFPQNWKNMAVTVDVEAKAKELAVLALKKTLAL
jgi:UV DNA damage endonuclease